MHNTRGRRIAIHSPATAKSNATRRPATRGSQVEAQPRRWQTRDPALVAQEERIGRLNPAPGAQCAGCRANRGITARHGRRGLSAQTHTGLELSRPATRFRGKNPTLRITRWSIGGKLRKQRSLNCLVPERNRALPRKRNANGSCLIAANDIAGQRAAQAEKAGGCAIRVEDRK